MGRILHGHRADDISRFAEIRNRAFSALKGSKALPEQLFHTMENQSSHRPDLTLAAEIDGKLVDIIRAVEDEDQDGASAFIGPLAVDEEYRGKGLGRALLPELLYSLSNVTSEKTPYSSRTAVTIP